MGGSPVNKVLRIALGLTVLSLVPSAPPVAQESSGPSMAATGNEAIQLNQAGNTLVITDSTRQRVAIYRIDDAKVTLVALRYLGHDLNVETPNEVSRTEPPTEDTPGEDPPDAVRPPKAFRTYSGYVGDGPTIERWWGYYAVQGTPAEVYPKVRSSFAKWKLASQSTDDQGRSRFKVASGTTTMVVTVGQLVGIPGWVQVGFTEERTKS